MVDGVLHAKFGGNSIEGYLTFLAIVLAGCLAIWLARKIILRRLRPIVRKTSASLDDYVLEAVDSKLAPIGYVASSLVAFQTLTLPPLLNKAVNVVGLTLLTFFGVRFALTLVMDGFEKFWLKRELQEGRRNAFKILVRIARVAIWGVAIVLLLDNLGMRIAPLVAGLGIGGVAVALAGQAILQDLFSCFAIFFDRPFEIGDFIVLGDFMGTVEYIGIKTTRLRSLSGEQIVIANHDLTGSRLRNYKRMEKRRVLFSIGVTYGTGVEQLRDAVEIITRIVKATPDTLFDRAHFSSYGDFKLVIEAVYYVLSGDYNKYMDTQQQINLRIKEEFAKRGIEFAYPTQTLYLSREGNGENPATDGGAPAAVPGGEDA